MIKDLILKNRSYRRFYQDFAVTKNDLADLIELARLSPSPKNKQVLKFMIFNEKEINSEIFETLAWAGYLKDWSGPSEGEKPAAYIILLADKTLSNSFDADLVNVAYGIACQSILLGAVEKGFGGCIIAAVKREILKKIIKIDDNLEILCVIALGKPKEEIVLEDIDNMGDIKYYRDENQKHHVPKRKLKDLIINF